MRLSVICLVMVVAAGCATLENPQSFESDGVMAPPLESIDGVLYDAGDGSPVGEFKFITDKLTFVALITIQRSQARPVPGEGPAQAKTDVIYPPFQGSFSGNYASPPGKFFLFGGPDSGKRYMIIHDGNTLYRDIFRKERPENEHLYLVSVMDSQTFIRVMDRRVKPFDPIAVLDTLRSQLVLQAVVRVNYK